MKLTAKEYANHRGVTIDAIRYRIKKGILDKCLSRTKEYKGWLIDRDLADQEWDEAAIPSNQPVAGGSEDLKAGKDAKTIQATSDNVSDNDDHNVSDKKTPIPVYKYDEPEPANSAQKYNKHRAEREAFESKLKELKYKKEAGELLPVEEVKKTIKKLVGETRQAMLSLPDKLGPVLLAYDDLHQLQNTLTEEINKALDSLHRFFAEEEDE